MKEIRAMRALLYLCLSPSKKARGREPPEGCLAVYVGAARERFVVRTECVNHRLFRALLEEAEEARGPYCYAADGPLELPCDAGAFARAVEAIEREMAEERTTVGCSSGGIVRAGHSAAHRTTALAGPQPGWRRRWRTPSFCP
ncbi:auxin-responsive protein SAUR71-like [Miscanthus floridulus]|uniref:auxin-responsive protein SAUR71-like n=1 Tax=Miscanthus floridulus TaxID=154761 RepID=UPI0034582CFC